MSPCHFGIYRGICVDNADPLGKGRIRASVPLVTGTDTTGWAWPCASPFPTTYPVSGTDSAGVVVTGTAAVHAREPSLGEGVFIMFEAGDVDHPIWVGVFTWQS